MKAIVKIQKQRDGSVAYLIFPRGKGTVRSFSENQGTGSRISFSRKTVKFLGVLVTSRKQGAFLLGENR